jgi:hypothetical protein
MKCTTCQIDIAKVEDVAYKSGRQLLCKKCHILETYQFNIDFLRSDIAQCQEFIEDAEKVGDIITKLSFTYRKEQAKKELEEALNNKPIFDKDI